MTAVLTPALFRGAEEAYHVSISVDGVPVDLTGYTLWSELWWRGEAQITFTVVNEGLEVIDLAPGTPGVGEAMPAQYLVRITEEQSATIPLGRLSYFKHYRLDGDGKTTIRGPFWLEVTE